MRRAATCAGAWRRRLARGSALLALVVLGATAAASGQTTTATLKGRVTDSGGTGLPSVVVRCESASHGGSRQEVLTDPEGRYAIPLLPPADDYYVKVAYPGFARVVAGPFELQAGRTRRLDITLPSQEETTETVRVEARGHTVDTESTKTGSSYNAEFLEGLPLIGHNYQDILVLAPGVTDTDGDGNPNVHGARDTGVQYRLDGGNITDPVSGTFGQNLNMDIIEEVEIITAGASAEYGRADGGFANIITKSGGNDFEGKVMLFWRGKFLDGDGANNNDVNRLDSTFPDFHDLRPTLSLGGAMVRDHLWYFGSVEVIDAERPVNQLGNPRLTTGRGHYGFGKITWQISADHKMALQINTDPLTFRGNNIALGVSPDSDFKFAQEGVTPQLKWTAILSPRLLMEVFLSRFNSGIAVTPTSRFFKPSPTELVTINPVKQTLQARYPCRITNCDPRLGERGIYQIDLIDGRINGPYFSRTDEARIRNALRTDLSYTIEDAWGQHSIKSGIEFADEKFRDTPITNPILLDETVPFHGSLDKTAPLPLATQVSGDQILLTFQPLQLAQRAASFNSSAYLLDAWKPRPNFTLNLGLRLDREDVDTSGFEFFDPRAERRRAIGVWDAVCKEARAQNLGTPVCLNRLPGNPPTGVPDNSLRAFRDSDSDGVNDVDSRIVALDLDGDGVVQMSGAEGQAQFSAFTVLATRETRNFNIDNTNLSPRLSFSWDPWANGKTKIFGTWGRYYDRLFLGTVTGEMNPDQLNFVFFPDPDTHVLKPGSTSLAASAITITQVDRTLRTPHTDEVTLGFERELAPEWSASLTYIRRKAYDLLQDVDFNHITCPQYGDVLGIDPFDVCGDGGSLEVDRFGRVAFVNDARGGFVAGSFNASAVSRPNGAPDLYTVSPFFNQVLRIGNFNGSDYEAYEFKLVRRLHRNWQMQASYTYSKAFGQAETFASQAGNDPQTTDDEEGLLDFDQRHVLKFQAVTMLPHGMRLGTIIQWAAGTPFSVVARIADQDQTGNVNFRQFFPTRQRNDQRNEGQWQIDARVEKLFHIGKVVASGFILAENLTNADDLVLLEFNTAAINGTGVDVFRRFGRRWELGMVVNF